MKGERRAPAAVEEDRLSLVLHLWAPLDAQRVQEVCDALRVLLADVSERDVVCHVHDAPDLSIVDALARLALLPAGWVCR